MAWLWEISQCQLIISDRNKQQTKCARMFKDNIFSIFACCRCRQPASRVAQALVTPQRFFRGSRSNALPTHPIRNLLGSMSSTSIRFSLFSLYCCKIHFRSNRIFMQQQRRTTAVVPGLDVRHAFSGSGSKQLQADFLIACSSSTCKTGANMQFSPLSLSLSIMPSYVHLDKLHTPEQCTRGGKPR